jgi:hypothetical protein
MNPRLIYVLQILALFAMVASVALPLYAHIPALALGAITIERTFKPLCISVIQRTP